MVIELSGVQFGMKPYAYDFRTKLHDTKFNYQLINLFWNGKIPSLNAILFSL